MWSARCAAVSWPLGPSPVDRGLCDPAVYSYGVLVVNNAARKMRGGGQRRSPNGEEDQGLLRGR